MKTLAQGSPVSTKAYFSRLQFYPCCFVFVCLFEPLRLHKPLLFFTPSFQIIAAWKHFFFYSYPIIFCWLPWDVRVSIYYNSKVKFYLFPSIFILYFISSKTSLSFFFLVPKNPNTHWKKFKWDGNIHVKCHSSLPHLYITLRKRYCQ